MRNSLAILLCLTLSACDAAGQEDPASLPRLRVEGNAIVDESGAPQVLQGVSFSDPDRLESIGRWGREYFEVAHSWGADLVRFPVHPSAWRERGHDAYLELIDRGVDLATELGMYVIIDWHSIGNLRTEQFFHERYETTMAETLEFWQLIAERYADNPTVAFYEVFNEPTSWEGQLGRLTWEEHRDISEEIIQVIYEGNPQAIPLVGGLDWGYDISYVADNPVRLDGVAYVSHPYPQKRPEPWPPAWERDFGRIAADYPVLVTEFGFMSADGPGAHIPVIGDERYGEAIVSFMADRGISWTVWVFDPEWSPQMFTGWDYEPTAQGAFFRDVMLSW